VQPTKCYLQQHVLRVPHNYTLVIVLHAYCLVIEELHLNYQKLKIIIIIHEFPRDASLETTLQGRYVSRITLQL